MDPRSYTVPPDVRRARADKVLAEAFPAHSRAALQRAFEAGLVRRNGVAIAKSDEVKSGDRVDFSLPEIVPAGRSSPCSARRCSAS